jgi:triphosphoribosyl-dephospho-CoA synthase
MRLAADRDLVARQYANNFAEIFELAVPALAEGLARGWALNDVIVHTFLTLMRDRPDTLIERKCGREVAEEAASYAASVLRSGVPGDDEYADALADLDFWLRADGHRRNPGTSADLIAAGLFVVLQQGIVKLPIRFYQTG